MILMMPKTTRLIPSFLIHGSRDYGSRDSNFSGNYLDDLCPFPPIDSWVALVEATLSLSSGLVSLPLASPTYFAAEWHSSLCIFSKYALKRIAHFDFLEGIRVGAWEGLPRSEKAFPEADHWIASLQILALRKSLHTRYLCTPSKMIPS